MFDILKKPLPRLVLEPVSVGAVTLQIPVARLGENTDRPRLLITAGNDGDEYAGIAACYRIIEEFSQAKFRGALTVIPIVNIPGFKQEMSQNPMDHMFPKYIYPGKKVGSPSEQLRYWVSRQAESSDLWMDLHGGSSVECLQPFTWTWESGDSEVEIRVRTAIEATPISQTVRDRPLPFSKRLGAAGCGYILVESGAAGNNAQAAVELHVDSVRAVMGTLMMLSEASRPVRQVVFRRVEEYALRRTGVWFPSFSGPGEVRKGETLGIVRSLDGNTQETVVAKQSGTLLWGKTGMRAAPGDIVAGIARFR